MIYICIQDSFWDGGVIMGNYREYKERTLQNPQVRSEYEALQPEYDIIQAMIDARVNQNITQKACTGAGNAIKA